jgi:hypothetical protein
MNKLFYHRNIINNRNKTEESNNKIDCNLNQLEEKLLQIIDTYSNTKNENIHLLISYYNDKNEDRQKEIDFCLKLNCLNKLFNKIIIINETLKDINFIDRGDNRIIIINYNNRLKFNDFFIYSNQYSNQDTINILINSDIIIGENFNKLIDDTIINMNNKVLFLSRYEVEKNNEFKINLDCGSFDTFIWKGIIKYTGIGNYFMGIGCCDVKLAYEFYTNKYLLKNPSNDLKTYHIHFSNIRNYNVFSNLKGKMLKIKHSSLNNIFCSNDYVFI